MRKLHIAGKLLMAFLLAAVLTACQNEEMVSPNEKIGSEHTGANEKTSALIKKLTTDGPIKLKYVTSGRFQGQLSQVVNGNYTTYYTFSDLTGNGQQTITAETKFTPSGSTIQKTTYEVANGRCIKSTDVTNNRSYIYQYSLPSGANETVLLEKISREGSPQDFREFSYKYNTPTGQPRLYKITYNSNATGKYKETSFNYTDGVGSFGAEHADKYLLNPEHTELDPYLAIFGKFSDVLVRTVHMTPYPLTLGSIVPLYRFSYFYNSNDEVTSRWRQNYPFGYGNLLNMTTDIFEQKYSYIVPGL